MSLVDFYDELAELAMGWLGWTEQQALSSDVNAIAVAYEGRVGMLKAIFGDGSKSEKAKVSSREMSPVLFDALFGG